MSFLGEDTKLGVVMNWRLKGQSEMLDSHLRLLATGLVHECAGASWPPRPSKTKITGFLLTKISGPGDFLDQPPITACHCPFMSPGVGPIGLPFKPLL